MMCLCSYSGGFVTELCGAHNARIIKEVNNETERCAKIAEKNSSVYNLDTGTTMDIGKAVAYKIRESKGSEVWLFEQGNMEKYQEHLDRHDDNAACDKCVLALRHKVKELEKKVNRTFLKVF